MEGLVSVVSGLVVLMILAIPFAFVYRHRAEIKRWVNDPKSHTTWEAKPTVKASRRVTKAKWNLEDAEAELAWNQEKDAKESAEE